jgi:hypothetical protein
MNDAATPGRRAPLSSAERAAVALLASGVVTFSTYGALTGAPSLAGYLAIVVGGLALLVWLRRSPLPDALAIGLSLVALGHLAGGLIRVGDDVLYNASPGIALLQWDHVVHSCGVFVGTIVVWLLLLQPVTRSLRTRDIVLVCVLAGLGLGAVNETVEFVATLAHQGSHVGGYTNTGWDLVANAIGATAGGAWLAVRGRRTGSIDAIGDDGQSRLVEAV